MPKTRDDLIKQALSNLGLLAEGQGYEFGMINKMDKHVDPALAELASLGVYYVQDAGEEGPSGGEIDDAAFFSIAAYLADAACASFNLPADAKIKVLKDEAVGKLTTITAPPRSRRTLRLDPGVLTYRRGSGVVN